MGVLQALNRRWWWVSLALLVLVTFGSLMPVSDVPRLPNSDKAGHVIAYALVALPLALRGHSAWLWLALACFGWSGMIELIQPYVSREAEWFDLIANGLGLILGAGLGYRARTYLHRV